MLTFAMPATAFAAPQLRYAPTQVRLNGPLVMSELEAAETTTLDTATTDGVVVPTGGAATATPQEFVDAGAFGPPRFTASTWCAHARPFCSGSLNRS